MKNKQQSQGPDRVIVHYDLTGPDAARFLEQRRKQHISNNAELGRKLMFERLDQLEEQAKPKPKTKKVA